MNRSLLLISSAVGLAALSAGVGCFTGCSSSGSQSASSGGDFTSNPVVGPDVPLPAGVTLQPNVVMVHGGASVIKSYSTDHGIWNIDKNASGVSNLTVGSVLLIAGVDCARVTGLTDNGDGTLAVTIAPVAFTDVIQNGSLTWQSSGIDLSQPVLGLAPYSAVVADEVSDAGAADAGADDAAGDDGGASDGGAGDEGGGGCDDAGGEGGASCQLRRAESLHLDGMGTPTFNPLFSATYGGWQVAFNATRSGNSVTLSATAAWGVSAQGPANTVANDPAQTLGGISTGLKVSATINNIQSTSGSLDISGGTLSNANMTTAIGGSANMSATMGTTMGSQFPKEALLRLPISVEYPFFWGPIPLYVSYTMAFLIQPSLGSQNSTLGFSSQVNFGGNAGVTFSNGTASPSGVPTIDVPDNPLNAATAPPEIGAMAVVFALQAPRIGFGVGTTAYAAGAKAGIYVDMVNSLGLVIAPATSLIPCQSADWEGVAHGGGEMSIKAIGASLSVTHQIPLTNLPEKSWYTPMVSACQP